MRKEKLLTTSEVGELKKYTVILKEFFQACLQNGILSKAEYATRMISTIFLEAECSSNADRFKSLEMLARSEGMYLPRARQIIQNVKDLPLQELIFQFMQETGASEFRGLDFKQYQDKIAADEKHKRLTNEDDFEGMPFIEEKEEDGRSIRVEPDDDD